jgi:hypothetical protein
MLKGLEAERPAGNLQPNGIGLVTEWLAGQWDLCFDQPVYAWTLCYAQPSYSWTVCFSTPNTAWTACA